MREVHSSQEIFYGNQEKSFFDSILQELQSKRVLLVCGKSFSGLSFASILLQSNVTYSLFQDFSPNPKYDDIVLGVEAYRDNQCDTILAVGGGSALDVAKCIKLFVPMTENSPYCQQPLEDSGIPLIAIPTTAGTGSESTQFAVIYIKGEKYSLSHPSILPNYVILESSVLKTLPLYQKKCSMLDAVCQALESWWSVNANEESIAYSKLAVAKWLEAKNEYLANSDTGNSMMLEASNLAGRAINITKTTAPHAMSYKLTTLFSIPHGHAVALAFPHVWKYMSEHSERCIDKRGSVYVANTLIEMAGAVGQKSVEEAINWFCSMLSDLSIDPPKQVTKDQLEILIQSVNIERLKNSPVLLDEYAIATLYGQILEVIV
nr:phosphonoacetaldehyde reductase [uncultured Sphaerochaeta sp.]